jgi:hypothetical protein
MLRVPFTKPPRRDIQLLTSSRRDLGPPIFLYQVLLFDYPNTTIALATGIPISKIPLSIPCLKWQHYCTCFHAESQIEYPYAGHTGCPSSNFQIDSTGTSDALLIDSKLVAACALLDIPPSQGPSSSHIPGTSDALLIDSKLVTACALLDIPPSQGPSFSHIPEYVWYPVTPIRIKPILPP